MSRPRILVLLFTGVLLAVATRLSAAEPADVAAAADTPGARFRERVLQMREFLDTMLPGVLQENNVTLHFTPKFSDVRDNEYVRFPLELRYGAGNDWEFSGGLTPFTPNPFNAGRDHRWGPGEIKLGARYDLGGAIPFFDDTTVGLETRVPLGKPPAELNDHYTHLKPFVAGARTLRMWPDVTFYANLSYDRTVKLTDREMPPPEVVRRHVIDVAPGLLYKPGQFGYFTEYRWRHISEPDGWRLGHEIQLGTIWDIPRTRSEKWKLPGKMQLELAYRVTHEEGRETDHGIKARVSWRTSLREVLNHRAQLAKPASP